MRSEAGTQAHGKSSVVSHIPGSNVGLLFSRAILAVGMATAAGGVLFAQQTSAPPPKSPTASTQSVQPKFFHITPLRPVAELRAEALKATPPQEHGNFVKSDLVEVKTFDPTIHLDIRYATPNNFLGTPVYEQARAFLQRPAAEALVRANRKLRDRGLGLLIHDAYRPWYVTKIFWEATPVDKREFVANPAEGSRHNRGCAVDITLYDLRTGRTLEMPSLYDEMSPRAYSNYTGGTRAQTVNRRILKDALESEGFQELPNEWWHFDYKDWKQYRIGNQRFDQITKALKTHSQARPESRPASAPEPNRASGDPDGVVVVQVEVDKNGIVKNTRVVRSLTPEADRRAIEAVKQSTFNPALKDGQPVSVLMNIEVKFGSGFSREQHQSVSSGTP